MIDDRREIGRQRLRGAWVKRVQTRFCFLQSENKFVFQFVILT